jgi:hypothetical protein
VSEDTRPLLSCAGGSGYPSRIMSPAIRRGKFWFEMVYREPYLFEIVYLEPRARGLTQIRLRKGPMPLYSSKLKISGKPSPVSISHMIP